MHLPAAPKQKLMPPAWIIALLLAAATAFAFTLWSLLRRSAGKSAIRIHPDYIALTLAPRWRATWTEVESVERSAGELRLRLHDGSHSPNLAPFAADPPRLAELIERCLLAARRADAMLRYAAQTGKVPDAEERHQ